MADRRDHERSPLDTIESVAGAALALGAGAALLYKSGGAEFLSSGVKKLSYALNDSFNTISKTALNDMDAGFVSNVVQGFKKSFSEADGKATLRTNNPDSLLNILLTRHQFTKNKEAFLYKMYDQDNILHPLKVDFQRNYAKGDSVLNRKVESIVDDFIQNIDESISYLDNKKDFRFSPEFIEKHFGDKAFNATEQDNMMQKLLDAYKKRNDELGQYVEENLPIVDNVISQIGDIDSLAKQFGMRGHEGKGQKFFDKVLNDQQATVNDIIRNKENVAKKDLFGYKKSSLYKPTDAMEMLEKLVEENPAYGDLYFDKAIRVNSEGGISSFAEAAGIKDKIADEFAQTLPGKIFKARDILEIKNAPLIHYMGPGEADPVLAKMAEGRDSTLLNNKYVRIMNKTFKINSDKSLEHISALDNTYLASGEHGTMNRLMKNITGDIDRRPDSKYKILRDLDIGSNAAPNVFKTATSFFTKFTDERWGRNLMDSFLDADTNELQIMVNDLLEGSDEEREEATKYISKYSSRIKNLDKFLGQTTNKLDRSTVNKLRDVTSGDTKRLMDMLAMNDDEMFSELTKWGAPDTFKNESLKSLMTRYLKDEDTTRRTMSIVSDQKGTTKAVRFTEMIRREVAKEAFITYKETSGDKNNALLTLFKQAGIKGQTLKETKYLANWALLQSAAKESASDKGVKGLQQMAFSALNIQNLFSGISEDVEHIDFTKAFRENMRAMSRENTSILQKGFQREEDIIPGHSFGKFMHVTKSTTPLDLIKNINDASKWKSFGKQFTAGRSNIEDVTAATMAPYFALFRLTDAVSSLNLGFSPKSTGTTIDLAASIMFKRVLPIAGAITALSYLDFESKNFTGTSLRGAAANNRANADLLGRRISDSIGLTGLLKTHHELNPMAQYLSYMPYQSYDERKEWYENGLSPVRKSRWWSFGSTSEFRGGKIDYFEPNYLKQAHSDWQDIGVYGSSDEKWKHSFIPTPRHPLAPLRALADPYWLENKHYWDRPYPESGKLFDEGTPWGVILNPTIGQMIKPIRKMHRAELGNNMIDVRSLIAQRNSEVRTKANKNSNLVRIDSTGEFTPVSYTPLGAPTGSERILNISMSNGHVTNAYVPGMDYGATQLTDYEPIHDAIQKRAASAEPGTSESGSGGPSAGGGSASEVNPHMSVSDRIQISADRGGVVGGMITGALPLGLISSVNQGIKTRAQIAPKGGQEGVITADAIFKKAKGKAGLLSDAQFASDLMNINPTKEFLKDAAYSSKELLGIYGFLFDEAFPSKRTTRLQGAGRMNSFTRRFWDASYGGLGGELLEIGRRFIPHEDHSIDRMNPLKNTMPDWMPSKFRYGDPYEQIPKGEMRLPGAAYEDINKLHSDQYGRYGAFDRMKILADIAPWSGEYRLWRDISSKTIDDQNLKDQMKQIKNNVQEQSKQHDFYPYKFKESKLDYKSAVINTVGTSYFTVVGDRDNRRYKMAGVNLTEGALKDYLYPGMPITLKYGQKEANQSTISAVIMAGGENLNRKLFNSGMAEESKDTSAAGLRARFTESQIVRGKFYETLAHAPIPILHDKFMRVNTPLESWKEEYVYGTSYATWSHPIQGFVEPAFRKAFAVGYGHEALGLATWMLASKVTGKGSEASSTAKILANAAFGLTNPGAVTGAIMGYLPSINTRFVKAGANIGAAIGTIGFAYTHANNPIFATATGAVVGRQIAEQFWEGAGKKGAIAGAAIGLAVSATKNPDFNLKRTFGKWIPGKVQKKWEIEEYYDRLRYIKYMGLYEKAARVAKRKEGVDIKRIMNKFEYDSKNREKIEKELLANKQLISNTYAVGNERRNALMSEMDEKLSMLKYPQQVLQAGEYTKSALAYRQSAESTVYGMKESATWSQVLRAVPSYERDYVLEFGKETDPEKRKEILKYMAPYRRKVLQTLWGEKTSNIKSNTEFFKKHKLPGLFWSGWQPDVDLDNVEIKNIKNEGMLLSDFGFYDSQSQTPEAMAAPSIDYDDAGGAVELRKNLLTALTGAGLTGVNVSIAPSSHAGVQMVANIARTTDYQIKQKLNGLLGRVFY